MSAPVVTTAVVITDTNVLVNFLHIGQLTLLGELPAYRFQLPAEALQELADPGHGLLNGDDELVRASRAAFADFLGRGC
jgi:hypothetical protein